jgi:hypothetical protein
MIKPIISPDQNTIEFNSKTYQFIPTKDRSDSACDICELKLAEACEVAPCMPKERGDCQNGYL